MSYYLFFGKTVDVYFCPDCWTIIKDKKWVWDTVLGYLATQALSMLNNFTFTVRKNYFKKSYKKKEVKGSNNFKWGGVL